jgi:prepilin-type N-terminal cleavage/methylation domain-containing protein
MKNTKAGFTILEILLVIAVLSIIASVSLPLFLGSVDKNRVDLATLTAVQYLRQAIARAEANDHDSAWGVKFLPGRIVMFQGDNYDARDAGFDRVTQVEGIDFAGDTLIIFPRISAELPDTATLHLRATANGQERKVVINPKGALTY